MYLHAVCPIELRIAFCRWEMRRLAARSFVDNYLRAVTTLDSLVKLLGKIQNMVIADHIAEDVNSAVAALQQSIHSVRTEEDFWTALNFAKQAAELADKAFYDPSMLALLYFPDDQKYAIYIPLFLPVGLPVVWSLRTLFLYYWPKKTHVD